MNLIKILVDYFLFHAFLQLLNPQSHHGDHIVVSHLNCLNHLSKFLLIIRILDLRKQSKVTERIQIPISNLRIKTSHKVTTHSKPVTESWVYHPKDKLSTWTNLHFQTQSYIFSPFLYLKHHNGKRGGGGEHHYNKNVFSFFFKRTT